MVSEKQLMAVDLIMQGLKAHFFQSIKKDKFQFFKSIKKNDGSVSSVYKKRMMMQFFKSIKKVVKAELSDAIKK